MKHDPKYQSWQQGTFIDGPEYRHMGLPWKERQREHETFLVRPGAKGNAICTATDPDAAVFIAARLNLAAKLEAALRKIIDLEFSEGDDPLDEAISIASKSLG